MQDKETLPEPTNATLPAGVDKVIVLPSGATATIYLGKGKNVRTAQKLSEKDTSLFMNALMAELVVIDGKRLLMEDYDQMAMPDYMELMGAVSENFTKSAPAI